jgi:hypothetical protein
MGQMWQTKRVIRRWGMMTLMMLAFWGLGACTTAPFEEPTLTPPQIIRPLATVFISPTPNDLQRQATAQAASPTPQTPTPTSIPSPTPYVGVFIGQAQRDEGFTNITTPFFAGDDVVALVPTGDASACQIPVDSVFARIWRINRDIYDNLGCPIQERFGFFGRIQVFEGGAMYLQGENNAVWAILEGDGEEGTYFYIENPRDNNTTGITAPPGFILPEGIFADMWLSVANLRLLIGYALTPPQDVGVNIQRFEGGTFFLDVTVGQIYALLADGSHYGPFNAPNEIPTPEALASPTPEATIESENPDENQG